MTSTWAFIGLGNPGAEYAFNRHNIGFMVIDALHADLNASSYKSKFNSLFSDTQVPTSQGSVKLILLKPQTYMNLSGKAVQALMGLYKIPLSNIVVFHDDLDLEPGRIKIKIGGSAGGHNGLKSIDASVGKDYWRVRIGIGHPGNKANVSNYVLSNFNTSELETWVLDIIHILTKSASDFLSHQDSIKWMKEINKE